jgi:hypothetical protein
VERVCRFEEELKGTLSVGKLADITVLTRDITSVPEDEIRQAKVALTIIGGKIVYKSDDSRCSLASRSTAGCYAVYLAGTCEPLHLPTRSRRRGAPISPCGRRGAASIPASTGGRRSPRLVR